MATNPKLKLSKAFPIIMDINTEVGQKILIQNIRRWFPKGTIPVVCPECGTKNNISIDEIEKYMKVRSREPIEFDNCTKCGRDLVFDNPMGPKRGHDPEKPDRHPRSRAEHIKMVEEKLPKTERPRRWDAKTGKWVHKN